jgi:hypothetical protein
VDAEGVDGLALLAHREGHLAAAVGALLPATGAPAVRVADAVNEDARTEDRLAARVVDDADLSGGADQHGARPRNAGGERREHHAERSEREAEHPESATGHQRA